MVVITVKIAAFCPTTTLESPILGAPLSVRNGYCTALLRLKEGLAGYETASDPQLARDGIIQRFEFTCELAWKTAREWLLDQGHVELNSPKTVMRQTFADDPISNSDGWIGLHNDRGTTARFYGPDLRCWMIFVVHGLAGEKLHRKSAWGKAMLGSPIQQNDCKGDATSCPTATAISPWFPALARP